MQYWSHESSARIGLNARMLLTFIDHEEADDYEFLMHAAAEAIPVNTIRPIEECQWYSCTVRR